MTKKVTTISDNKGGERKWKWQGFI